MAILPVREASAEVRKPTIANQTSRRSQAQASVTQGQRNHPSCSVAELDKSVLTMEPDLGADHFDFKVCCNCRRLAVSQG